MPHFTLIKNCDIIIKNELQTKTYSKKNWHKSNFQIKATYEGTQTDALIFFKEKTKGNFFKTLHFGIKNTPAPREVYIVLDDTNKKDLGYIIGPKKGTKNGTT